MIAEYLYRHPRILVLVVIVIVAGGVSSLFVLPRLEDPVLGQRVGVLSTAFPGAGPQRVESLVTIPLEESLSGIADIRRVRSNSQRGISNIVIELDDHVTDVAPVWSLVRDQMEDARGVLPPACREPELQVVPLQAYAAIIAIHPSSESDLSQSRFRTAVRNLRHELTALPGTRRVDVFGDRGEEYVAEVAAEDLIQYDKSLAEIAEAVRGGLLAQPAGRFQSGGAELGLQLTGEADPIALISSTPIASGGDGATVTLGDLATVSLQESRSNSTLAIVDGAAVAVLGVLVNDEERVDRWAGHLAATLSEFDALNAGVAEVDLLFSQRDHIDGRMILLLKNLAGGTAAVVVVVLILMGWRSMLVVAAALPLSALLVLSGMRLLGIPIHQMSVTGLIIALGLLIDNAIVIVEDVRARIVDGVPPPEAILSGIRHLRMPLFGSTLTTALAFLPIATLPGPPGEFVGTIATSVILAISASFVLAMSVIPALISLLQIPPRQRGFLVYGLTIGPLRRLYEYSLWLVVRAPVFGVVLGVLLPAAGYLAAMRLPEQFFPPAERPQIQVELELAAREPLSSTAEAVRHLQSLLEQFPEVRRQYWFVGESAPTFFYNVVPRRRGAPFYAQAFVDLGSDVDTGELVRVLQRELDQSLPQGRVLVRQLQQGPPFDAPVEVRLKGPDAGMLQSLGSTVRRMLAELPQVIHTRSDLEETIPYVALSLNETASRLPGLDRSQLSGLMYTALEGMAAGTVFRDGEDIPVRIRMPLNGTLKQERLAAMPLPGFGKQALDGGAARGQSDRLPLNAATLSTLTDTTLEADVGAIVRIDGKRTNEIKAWLEAETLPSTVLSTFRHALQASGFQLPAGYSLEFGGESEQRSQAVDKLIANGVVLFSLMLLTLAGSFQSFRCALIIAAVGGLSAGLGPLALSACGWPFGFMAIVGSMGLVGVAINDSIVVLAAIRENSAAAAGEPTALVDVVTRCTRHIVATTVTTMVGFLPLILSGGGFWPPLAVTVAGGVGGATLLALYFVPCLHVLLYGRRRESDSATVAEDSDNPVLKLLSMPSEP